MWLEFKLADWDDDLTQLCVYDVLRLQSEAAAARPLVALSALTTTPLRPLSAGRATSEWSTTGVPTASPSEATPVGLAAMMFVAA